MNGLLDCGCLVAYRCSSCGLCYYCDHSYAWRWWAATGKEEHFWFNDRPYEANVCGKRAEFDEGAWALNQTAPSPQYALEVAG